MQRAFEDLLIDKKMLLRLGPAINSGRGMFLFGAPGNGKTSIAERITKAFGRDDLDSAGDRHRRRDHAAVRPGHARGSAAAGQSQGCLISRKIDQRWVRIRRPTIVVGGELTMDQLEITLNTATNVSEAPVQMKSNCGTLVIDDFGRQRMTTDQLLNRWIVPLEKRYDFLNLASGKKIQVPFDQLIVFSTNLEPKRPGRRRVPAADSVQDRSHRPTMSSRSASCSRSWQPKWKSSTTRRPSTICWKSTIGPSNRPLRCCQPRDLILQILNFCRYTNKPAKLTPENLDFAVGNYFAVM